MVKSVLLYIIFFIVAKPLLMQPWKTNTIDQTYKRLIRKSPLKENEDGVK